MDSSSENSAEAEARAKAEAEAKAEVEVDRLLGNLALIKLDALQPMGGPSPQTLSRAAKAGLIEIVKNGSSADLTRATAKRILLYGLGPIPFLYGKQGAKKLARAEAAQMAVRAQAAKHAAQQATQQAQAPELEPIGYTTGAAKRAKKTDKFEKVA